MANVIDNAIFLDTLITYDCWITAIRRKNLIGHEENRVIT